MIENDDSGCKAGLSGLAEFPGRKSIRSSGAEVQSADENAGGYLPGSPPGFI